MDLYSFILWVLLLVLINAVANIGTFFLFKKAGHFNSWKAFVPIWNIVELLKLVGRPNWWIALFFIPLINFFVGIGLMVDVAKSFGKTSFLQHVGAILLAPLVFLVWGLDKDTKYLGGSATEAFKKKYPYKKSTTREWADAIVFAVVAATIIRTFFIEAFMIPTGSMERSLLIGDFLFVSKVNYGARLPITPVSFPFAHHTMPVIGTKSYWDGIQLSYRRLPALQQIKRNDVVVFNYPMDADEPFNRPVDKRENYIKRAVGIPGDTLWIDNAQVYVNGTKEYNPPGEQLYYTVITDGTDINPDRLHDLRIDGYRASEREYLLALTEELAQKLSGWSNIVSVMPRLEEKGHPADMDPVFPKAAISQNWNQDNYGPIIIPKKGWTVQLNEENLPIYERAIGLYEGNKLEKREGAVFINGERANSYTFKMDYYWMMGDNRHNSLDSRYWGFVPEDHIVGKALLVWMSLDDKAGSLFERIRWNRIFKSIH
ncbi:signal peptidase I [Olivibacter sitiensis]|uniref:signal peptidase I n=1 Tax=Olivibacter sitiensis TaxID=376470 RepID=UPI00042166B2|nr:signal peptidase I [Olivibacter sitiensis]